MSNINHEWLLYFRKLCHAPQHSQAALGQEDLPFHHQPLQQVRQEHQTDAVKLDVPLWLTLQQGRPSAPANTQLVC